VRRLSYRHVVGNAERALRRLGSAQIHYSLVSRDAELAKPAVSSLIIGASTAGHVEGNLAAADFSLSAGEIAALDPPDPPAPIYPGPRWLTGGDPPGGQA